MKALLDIKNKEFTVLAGETIPKKILKIIDVDRLVKEKVIAEDEKPANSQYNSNKKDHK